VTAGGAGDRPASASAARGSALSVTLLSDAPVYGGGERYLETLAAGFPPEEVRADVILSEAADLDACAARLNARGLHVTRLPAVTVLKDVGPLLRNLWRLAWRRTQLIHANLVDPRACNGAIVAAAMAGHRAILATEHLPSSPFDDKPAPLRHRTASALIRRRIVVSEASKAALVARGVAAETVDVVPNGIVEPPYLGRAAARHLLWPGCQGPLIGWSGRLAAQKRPELFVQIAQRVARARPDVRFVLLGDGALRADLEALVRAGGLSDVVRLVGHRPDAPSLYAGLAVLVMTSRYEGQPLTLIEAGLAQTPVVAGRIPGLDEVVVDGAPGAETGTLVPPDDVDAYAAATLAWLADDDRRRAAGAAARARMLRRHSPQAMVRATIDAYRRVSPRAAR